MKDEIRWWATFTEIRRNIGLQVQVGRLLNAFFGIILFNLAVLAAFSV